MISRHAEQSASQAELAYLFGGSAVCLEMHAFILLGVAGYLVSARAISQLLA
jgi:hypothetical protein